MTTIRYGRHFLALIVAGEGLWLALNRWHPDIGRFALFGALHSLSLVISLRRRRSLTSCAIFITLATILSSLSISMTLLFPGPFALMSFFAEPLSEFAAYLVYANGSSVGAMVYWLLVRYFWLTFLKPVDLLRTVTLCVLATSGALLLMSSTGLLDSEKREVTDLVLTAAWWTAFSGSLYWSERRLARSHGQADAAEL